MYQESHPVTQTVSPILSRIAVLYNAAASGVGVTWLSSPEIILRTQPTTKPACDSAIGTSEVLPIGLLGPISRKKFGNPGRATVRWARGPFSQASSRVIPSRPVIFMGRNYAWVSNPVASARTSSSWSRPSAVTTPRASMWSIRVSTTSTAGRWIAR